MNRHEVAGLHWFAGLDPYTIRQLPSSFPLGLLCRKDAPVDPQLYQAEDPAFVSLVRVPIGAGVSIQVQYTPYSSDSKDFA